AGIPGPSQADAAEPSPTSDKVRIQYLGHGIPESQIGGAHNACGNTHRAVLAGGAHRGNAVDELDLAHGAHGFRPVGFEHRGPFDEHGRHTVMPAPHIRQDLVEKIAWSDAWGPEIHR